MAAFRAVVAEWHSGCRFFAGKSAFKRAVNAYSILFPEALSGFA
jgi:hypothetical protein